VELLNALLLVSSLVPLVSMLAALGYAAWFRQAPARESSPADRRL
jgi:hypothetical protein